MNEKCPLCGGPMLGGTFATSPEECHNPACPSRFPRAEPPPPPEPAYWSEWAYLLHADDTGKKWFDRYLNRRAAEGHVLTAVSVVQKGSSYVSTEYFVVWRGVKPPA